MPRRKTIPHGAAASAAATSSRRLAGRVWVADPDTGEGQYWGPEDEIPADVASSITNPKAWAPEDDPEPGKPEDDLGADSGSDATGEED
ncbi:MAG: hypothetical protein ACRCZP_11765 [Phycicoccus sp.]